jgi:hypothetical protein
MGILVSAYLGSNKIQRKDCSATLDPGDAIGFAEGLGLPAPAKFREGEGDRTGDEDANDPPGRGESFWLGAQELEGR